jgi:hypothetical protein
MKRVFDPNEPWQCPPSLVRVFARRNARQELREAKGRARLAEHEVRKAQAVVDKLNR